ncbi:DUF1919 domain-containing protein [Fusobacterium sp. HC1336]|uniref:DUF1919 domain-containing protein n=1 Tax=Fusobacterium sp. HC1336 TaxID=3171169 RepID=UPI003F23D26D
MFLEEEEKKLGYPVALLGDGVKIYFQHYDSREEAEEKWKLRSERINYNNIFIMSTERDMCSYEDLKNFDKLPYSNKVIFTRKKYPEIKSSFYIKGFEDKKEVGVLFKYRNKILMKRYYEDFDFIKWFNSNLNKVKL